MEHTSKVKRDFWTICNKIRDVVNFIKFNFWEYYSIYDVNNTGFVTAIIFKNALSGPLKSIVNLNDEEIQFLVRYFENSNGQVPYGQFCEIIHNDLPKKNEDELNWMKQNNLQSISTDVSINDKSKENGTRSYDNKNVTHPLLTNKAHIKDNVLIIMRKLQNYVFANRIDIGQFFKTFDPHGRGHVTVTQFRRCLDMIGVSSLRIMYYPEAELSVLLLMYKDKEYPERIKWKQFEDEINTENDKLHSYVCDCKIYGVQQMQLRRLKTDTPKEKKDAKYYEKRKRNNMAAKKSREAKRRRDNEIALKLFLLEKENMLLKFRLSTVSEELEIIKRTLVLYNTNQVIWTNNVLPTFQKK